MAQANNQQVKKLGDVNATTGLQRWIVSGTNFFLPPKYEVQQVLGSGAYGVVVAAIDTENPNEEENIVAIKKIEKAFEHKVFSQRTLRELKIMRLLKHENVLGCKSILMPRSMEDFNELYVITDLMETDLTSIIKSNQTLTDEHVQFFIYQILRGLKYVHSSGILHRDLKPRNLLVNANCDLKICDFGLARSNINTLMTQSAQLTDYVVTRWYRAPEVILSYSQYTGAMDVWSVGCILAELLRRKPLMPASTEQEQMMMIAKLVGKPPTTFIEQIEGADDRQFMRALPNHRGQDFNELFSGHSSEAIDLIKKMLAFDPQERITVEQALAHPYMSRLHDAEDEPSGTPVPAFDFDFELFSLKIPEFKELMFDEIKLYHDEEAKTQYEVLQEEYPNGHLHTKWNKTRLRTMYKRDPVILKIFADEEKKQEAKRLRGPGAAAAQDE